MKARLLAFAIWAAVAASVMYWALRLLVPSPPLPAHAVVVGAPAAPRGDLSRVFGAAPAPAPPGVVVAQESSQASRFKLLGVASPRQGGDRSGLALIAIDGKPARSFKVGAVVDGELVLQAVHPRGARLGATGAPPQVSLELPALPAPAVGTLAQLPAVTQPAPVAGLAPVPMPSSPAPVVQAPVELPVPPPFQAGRPNTR